MLKILFLFLMGTRRMRARQVGFMFVELIMESGIKA